MIWDFTCADSLCDSYVRKSAKKAGSAAEIREEHKSKHYKELANYYHFVPVCVETFGAWGSQGLKLVKEIGKLIQDVTYEKRSTFYLLQNISMAIQRGNAACIVGRVPASEGLDKVFDLVDHSADI